MFIAVSNLEFDSHLSEQCDVGEIQSVSNGSTNGIFYWSDDPESPEILGMQQIRVFSGVLTHSFWVWDED